MHVPPTCSRSTTATFQPARPRAIASGLPDWPVPMMTASCVLMMISGNPRLPKPLYVEVPALALRRARYSTEAPIAVLLVKAGSLKGVRSQVDQPAAAPPRAALGLVEQLAADSFPARSRRQPEQLDVALPPIRLQDEPAQQPPFAVPSADYRVR